MVGVDKVPIDAVSTAATRRASRFLRPSSCAPAAPSGRSPQRRAWSRRGGTWSFIAKPIGRIVRRRTGRSWRSPNPNRVRSVRHAARACCRVWFAAATGQRRPRLFSDVALFEVGPGVQGATGRRINGSRHPAFGTAFASSRGHRGGTGPARQRPTRSTPRPTAFAALSLPPARRCRRCRFAPGRRGLAASGTLRHHPDRSAKRARIFRASCIRARWRRSAPTVR